MSLWKYGFNKYTCLIFIYIYNILNQSNILIPEFQTNWIA